MNMKIAQLALAGVVFVSISAFAQDKACSPADAARAEKVVDNAASFAQLDKAWQDYRHCDAGPVADVYTESLLRLLVDWKGVEALASAMQSSPQYKEWVLKRVKAATPEDREVVFSRAKTGCPAKLEGLCGELAEASSDAAPTKIAVPAAAPAPASSAPALRPAPTPPK